MRSTTAAAGGSVCSTSPKSIRIPPDQLAQVLAELTALEPAVPGGPVVLAAGDDDPAAGQHGIDPAGDLHALVGRVIHVHVMRGGRQDLPGVRVVDDDVSVGSRRQHAL